MSQHEPPFRSQRVLRHAKGQPCCLRFDGCDGGGETTVACHIRDKHKGMAQKASDHSIVFGCAHCHRLLDEGFTSMTPDVMFWHLVRGLQETWAILIRDGIIVFPHDAPDKPRAKKPIRGRSTFPAGRKMQSKPFAKARTK